MRLVRLLIIAGLVLGIGAGQGTAQTITINAHHTFTLVSGTSVVALAALSYRKYLGLINEGSNVVHCTVDGQTAVANQGIRLAATGTTGDRHFFDRQVPQGSVQCIAATGTNRILVIEGR